MYINESDVHKIINTSSGVSEKIIFNKKIKSKIFPKEAII